MLILISPANAGVRTVAGLWKFRNGEKHEDGIDFNELCAVGSKIAAGSRGFPGNLFDIYAGLSDDGELTFRFGYQPSDSERDVSADDLQQQFADFFARHTHAYLGFEITSDKTPAVEVKPAPLPRNSGRSTNLPLAISSNDKDVDGWSILRNWGIRSWGSSNYIGWQEVELPQGWTIILEDGPLLLVDDFNQVRGEIHGVFEQDPEQVIYLGSETAARQTARKRRSRKKKPAPALELRTSISFRSSFSLADYGPYDYWVENAAGERLFGIYRQPVMDDECEQRLPQLRERIFDWLKENYPNWQDYNAYWDVFPKIHAKWAEAKQRAYSVATKILEGKTDDDLHKLRSEIGVGEQRVDYTFALQEHLREHFDEKPPFQVAEAVVYMMMNIFDMRIGRVKD